jgi:dihydroorotate dehydrogenase (fumarate)
MDLSTRYLGIDLPHPLMPGASPLCEDLDSVRRLEDAGAAAIVMPSLFEEEIERHAVARRPDDYLELIGCIKAAVDVPVIASLNGTTSSEWLAHARLIEEAGADALELNVYYLPTDPAETSAEVERRLVQSVRVLHDEVKLPLAIKLSPFFSALPHLAAELHRAGASGLVMFNRFYQADIDPERLQARPALHLSDPSELLLRLRWLAILHARVRGSLAVSGGVHSVPDVVRAVMAGADAVQLVSALLMHGPSYLAVVKAGLSHWLEEHQYSSLSQIQGSMSLSRCRDPGAFERGAYMHILQSWGA